MAMTEAELNRVVQYVTATTSYGRETVDQIVRISVAELATLATGTIRQYDRESLLEYVRQWTITRTGQPEPLVREVLDCAGRWLGEMCRALSSDEHQTKGLPHA